MSFAYGVMEEFPTYLKVLGCLRHKELEKAKISGYKKVLHV